jgi:ribosome maturation factor RimP
VSSPGIDRPLVRLRDYERFKGHLAKLEVEPDLEGRKRFKAVIENVEGDDVLIGEEGRTFRVPFASIRKARLVLTDELIAAAQAAQAGTDEASLEGGV